MHRFTLALQIHLFFGRSVPLKSFSASFSVFPLSSQLPVDVRGERDRSELKTWVVRVHYQPSVWLVQQRYVTNKWIRAAMLMRK